ncbi:MAG TPA: PorV/PorQ family protein [Bacteroidota bacterium]|nr:PorV/PorQ family protein [Bacteroidota bacterium]
MERGRGHRNMLRWASLVAAVVPLAGGQAQTVIAKYAGEFISIGVGARALAMGGAFAALANDVTAGYWNPAGLARIDYPQFILMHDAEFGGLVNNDYGAVALPVGERTSLGLSIIRVGVDNIADTRNAGVDASGNVTYDPTQFTRIDPSRVTYFNAADWALYFSYARRQTETFSYGASVKLIRRDLAEYSAMGIGFDIGFWYRPFDSLSFGANLQDITTTLVAWNTGRNELISPTVKLGSAYFLELLGGRISPAVDVDIRFENRQSASMAHVGPVSLDFHGGMEYEFRNLIALRAGYSDVKQLTLGAGVHFPKLNIDYSFARFGGADQLDNTHRISIMFTLEAEQYKRSGQ